MNFNDIELRLRYPHLFKDEHTSSGYHPAQSQISLPPNTVPKPNLRWLVPLRSLFRMLPDGQSKQKPL